MMRSPIPRGALHGLLFALMLSLPWPSAARAQDSPSTSRGPTVEFRGFETCAAVEQATLGGERHDWRIEWEEHDLTDNADGSPAPLLCLLAAPDVPSYVAILVQPPALFRRLEDYRAARRAAMERLTEAGLDLCEIGAWHPLGLLGVLQHEDMYDPPADYACSPRLVAGDPAAAAWLPQVQEILTRVAAVSAEQLGERPNRPLTVVAMTDTTALQETFSRTLAPAGAGTAEVAVQDVRSHHLLGLAGSEIRLDLRPVLRPGLSPDEVAHHLERVLAHEYTHYLQHATAGGVFGRGSPIPHWFLEGQSLYQEFRVAGPHPDLLNPATFWLHTEPVLHLMDLSAPEDWTEAERTAGQPAVYGPAFAAMAYLVERHGFAATAQLLRDSRFGNGSSFSEQLAELSGLPLSELDGAIHAWLTRPGRVLLRAPLAQPLHDWPAPWNDGEISRARYDDGELVVTKLDQNVRPRGPVVPTFTRDFEAEIEARLVTPTPGAYLHLGFRRQQADGQRYELAVDPAARAYRLRLGTGGDWTTLLDWTPTPAIEPGTVRNRLGVRAQGADLVLLVNGQVVGRTRHAQLADGGFSFGVGSSGEAPVEGRFRNLVISNP
jgi:hypothetical protein